VRHEGKRALANTLSSALAGSRDVSIDAMLRVQSSLSGSREATVIGRRERLDFMAAAFLNAAIANVEDFDDTHIPTIIHPSAVVAAALFAWAERRPTRGRDLLHAFVLGVDVECRIGNAVHPDHYRRGWHITATCGAFGAAAAIGKLLGLDETGMVWALGNASAQASGLVETLGTMAKSIGVGNAARHGIAAALFAEAGVSGPARPLEGPRGFVPVTSNTPNPDAITRDLGRTWEICRNTYKPYPCGVVLFPVIDGCLALRARHGVTPGRIAAVTVRGHPLLRERADRPDVTEGREARVSLQHSVAVAFIHGAAGSLQYTDRCVAEPPVQALRRRVTMHEDPELGVESVEIVVETTDGQRLVERVPHWHGSLARPLTDAEIEAKLRALAAEATPWCDVARLIDALWTLDRATDGAVLMALVSPPAR
jgi:2-methylcitrate dehydratase PrpD